MWRPKFAAALMLGSIGAGEAGGRGWCPFAKQGRPEVWRDVLLLQRFVPQFAVLGAGCRAYSGA